MQHSKIDRIFDQTCDANVVPPKHVVMLTETYRLSPTVVAVLAPLYGGRLRSATERIRRERERPKGSLPSLILIDTSGGKRNSRSQLRRAANVHGQQGGTRKAGTSRRMNAAHAAVMHDLLAHLAERNDAGSLRIAVISLYHAHLNALRRVVRRLGWSSRETPAITAIRTVHKSQGWEEDVVIVDLPTAPTLPHDGFLHSEDAAQTGARLVNVGLSRARTTLIVIANVKDLTNRGSRAVWQLVRACIEHGIVIRAEAVRASHHLD